MQPDLPRILSEQRAAADALPDPGARLDRRGMPDPKRNPPPTWCELRKGGGK